MMKNKCSICEEISLEGEIQKNDCSWVCAYCSDFLGKLDSALDDLEKTANTPQVMDDTQMENSWLTRIKQKLCKHKYCADRFGEKSDSYIIVLGHCIKCHKQKNTLYAGGKNFNL